MTDYAKKSSPVFFGERDEVSFGASLKELIPGIQFVDGSLWENDTPPVKPSIPGCQNRVIFFWDKDAFASLPFQRLDNGKTRGPTYGVVVQFMRLLLKNRL